MDIVVNGAALAGRLPYASTVANTRFLLGAEYALLRPEFWEQTRPQISGVVERVLVTVGGGDPGNVSAVILNELEAVPGPLAITLVVGPFFEEREALITQAGAAVMPSRSHTRPVRSWR